MSDKGFEDEPWFGGYCAECDSLMWVREGPHHTTKAGWGLGIPTYAKTAGPASSQRRCAPCHLAERNELYPGMTRAEAKQQSIIDKQAGWVEDYQMLRRQGLSHQQIAKRLGVEINSLTQRVSRYDCFLPIGDEVVVQKWIESYCATGQEFTVADLPFVEDDYSHMYVIADAVRHNRIRTVGRKKHPFYTGKTTEVYAGV